MNELAGKIALITGGASGIGLSVANRLAQAGMRIAISDIEKPAMDTAVNDLLKLGHDAIGIPCDVSDENSFSTMKTQLKEEFGSPTIICLNAGVGSGGPIAENTLADWKWVIGANLWGVIHGLHFFLPELREKNTGHIVITASIAGHISVPGLGPYTATKFAAVSIAETLRQELISEGSNIGVSCLCPGLVSTNIWESERNRPEALMNKTPSESNEEESLMKDAYLEWIKANAKQPSEVAEMVLKSILDDKFWIFTDDDHREAIEARHFSITSREELPNPPPPLLNI